MAKRAALPVTVVDRLAKHVKRLNSAAGRLTRAGYVVEARFDRDGQLIVAVDGKSPEVIAAKLVLKAAQAGVPKEPTRTAPTSPPKKHRPAAKRLDRQPAKMNGATPLGDTGDDDDRRL